MSLVCCTLFWLFLIAFISTLGNREKTPKKRKNAQVLAIISLLACVEWIGFLQGPSSSSPAVASASPPDPTNTPDLTTAPSTPDPTDPLTPKPESLQQQKREFLATVNESVSGERIAGNKLKFVGTNVDLHGEVGEVVNKNTFNLQTGAVSSDNDGNISDASANIVVTCDSTTDLEKGPERSRYRHRGLTA